MRGLPTLSTVFASLLLSSCGGFVHDEVMDEPYHLVAVDVMEEMLICRRSGDICNGDELGGATVFMAGWDKKYVVGAPSQCLAQADEPGYHGVFLYRPHTRGEERQAPISGPF
jgi:hypothetical protein